MKIKNYKELLDRVEAVTKQKGLDLSSGEDLSIGIMNLISIEEHLFYTSQKTKDKKSRQEQFRRCLHETSSF